jgi:phosphohistidine swiveling domain-containing protein
MFHAALADAGLMDLLETAWSESIWRSQARSLQRLAQRLQQSLGIVEMPHEVVASLEQLLDTLPGETYWLTPQVPLLDPRLVDRAGVIPGLRQIWVESMQAGPWLHWQRQYDQPRQIPLGIWIQPNLASQMAGRFSIEKHCSEESDLALSRLTLVMTDKPGQSLDQVRQMDWHAMDSGKVQPSPAFDRAWQDLMQTLGKDHTPLGGYWCWDGQQLRLLRWAERGRPKEISDRHHHRAATFQGLKAAPGFATGRAWVEGAGSKPLGGDYVLVMQRFILDDLPLLKGAVGVVLEEGGMTSHGAILARELGIPAVVGVVGATSQLQSGDRLALHQGNVFLNPPADLADHLTPQTAEMPPTRTELWVNLNQPDSLLRCAQLPGVKGVGLLRSELFWQDYLRGTSQHQAPNPDWTEPMVQQLGRVLETFAPRPVYYRTLDWRSFEQTGLEGQSGLLGLHGPLSYQQNPDWFDWELALLAQLPQRAGLRLILPFVRTVEEFEFCQGRIRASGLGDLPLWIMAEVPSVLYLLPDYVKAGVQGIALGLNDLLQLLYAADRDGPTTESLINPRHPAANRALAGLVRSAQALGLPVRVCSLTQDSAFIKDLVDWGITGISAEVSELAALSQALNQAETPTVPHYGQIDSA